MQSLEASQAAAAGVAGEIANVVTGEADFRQRQIFSRDAAPVDTLQREDPAEPGV